MDEVQKKGIAAPRMLYIGEIEDKLELLKFCIESKVPGTAMDDLLETGNLTSEQIDSIHFQVGSILANIHSITPQGFGKFHEAGKGKYDSWNAFMLKYSKWERGETIALASKAGISQRLTNLAIDIIEDHKSEYVDVKPHLLHFDFSPKHILIVDGHVSGIVDFENCMSGDYMYDLAWKEYFNDGSQSLMDGYQSVSKIPNDYRNLLNLYGLRIGLDLIRWFVIVNNRIGMNYSKVKMEEYLVTFLGQIT